MRKALFAIISPVLAAALLFSACAKPAEQPVIDVTATEAPTPEETAAICGDGYTVEVKTVYYPRVRIRIRQSLCWHYSSRCSKTPP